MLFMSIVPILIFADASQQNIIPSVDSPPSVTQFSPRFMRSMGQFYLVLLHTTTLPQPDGASSSILPVNKQNIFFS